MTTIPSAILARFVKQKEVILEKIHKYIETDNRKFVVLFKAMMLDLRWLVMVVVTFPESVLYKRIIDYCSLDRAARGP